MLLAAAIERLYDLNVGTTPVQERAPHEKPHKPLLLMAAFDLIDDGLATPNRIPWCQEIRDRFTARFLIVKKHNDQNNSQLKINHYYAHPDLRHPHAPDLGARHQGANHPSFDDGGDGERIQANG